MWRVATSTCFFMCVPSLGEIRTWNLKHANIQWITSAIFIIYTVALSSNVSVMLFCGLDCRNYYGMACC
jgi:hypothetical protein